MKLYCLVDFEGALSSSWPISRLDAAENFPYSTYPRIFGMHLLLSFYVTSGIFLAWFDLGLHHYSNNQMGIM